MAKELEDMESTASCPQLSFSQVASQIEALSTSSTIPVFLYRMKYETKSELETVYIDIYIFICGNILDRQPTSWSRA